MLVVNQREKEINKYLLEKMPDIMYHGCIGNKFKKSNFLQAIKIFSNIDEYNLYEQEKGYSYLIFISV